MFVTAGILTLIRAHTHSKFYEHINIPTYQPNTPTQYTLNA